MLGYGRKSFKPCFEKKQKIDRITIVKWVVFVLSAIIICRLFQLQVIQKKHYQELANKNHNIIKEIEPKRGQIYVHDRNEESSMHPVATNKDFYDLYAIPSKIENPTEVVYQLIKILYPIVLKYEKTENGQWVSKEKIDANKVNLDEKNIESVEPEIKVLEVVVEKTVEKDDEPTDEELLKIALDEREVLLARLSKQNDPYEPIKTSIDENLAAQITALNIEGIGLAAKTLRYYPDGDIFSQITGFWGYKGDDRVGRYGVEEYFENILKGENGQMTAEKDATGGLIPTADLTKTAVKDGADIILTLDYPIQFNACNELKSAVEKYGAKSGSVLVINPKTGAMLAMCNYPSYDANKYGEVEDINLFLNRSISYAYEPGSIFKPFTMGAALNSNTLKPDDTYNDTGEVKIGPYTIRNSDKKGHGIMTMLGVLKKSLNTGVIYMVDKMGKSTFKDYVNQFGFGQATEIELPGEIAGNISSLDKNGDIYAATASFGQGITVTPLQIINGFAAIANDGKLMKPHIIDRIVYADGTIEETKPTEIRQVLSSASAVTLSAMLASVVEDGYGNKAGVEGYYIGGKTGTAQVSNENSTGYSNKTIHSFVGFGPINDPQFVILVKLDNVTATTFAESSAAPAFKKIAQFIINYYGIKPQR
ncbi:MAG: penicillin-binding protein 2 [Patescibacteria group bacterium]